MADQTLQPALSLGWTNDPNTWTRKGNSVFTLTVNATTWIYPGVRIRCKTGGSFQYGVVGTSSFPTTSPLTSVSSTVATSLFTKTSHGLTDGMAVTPTGLVNTTGVTNGTTYFVVTAAANTFQLSATLGGAAITLGGTDDSSITMTGATAVTLLSTSDYTLAAATVTEPAYSYMPNPQGWPGWFNWAPTITGYSANPTSTVYRWTTVGRTIILGITEGTAGTSNATTKTYSVPIAAGGGQNLRYVSLVVDNNIVLTAVGLITINSGGTTFSVFTTWAAAAWTASGNARVVTATVIYEF